MQYVSFADESYLDGFKSIAAFLLKSDNLLQTNSDLKAVLLKLNVRKFKGQKLKDAKYRYKSSDIAVFSWGF